MTNQVQSSNYQKPFDLDERTAQLGEGIISFVKKIERNPINNSLISQLVRSATSIGANYMEADGSNSKLDFKHKMSICKKESKETLHWLRMIASANPQYREESRIYWKETHELVLIFSTILKK